MSFNLKQLEAFVWVSDLGSFRKAAERLNTTQPNISSRIAALETVLDTQLMERDAGSVRLSAKGQELLNYARKVLKAGDNLIDAANRVELFDDVLRLGVTEMVVHTWLREFLKQFKVEYPNITVEITVDLSANIEKELFERSIDLAFQSSPFGWKSSGSEKLGSYPFVWIASPMTDFQPNVQVGIQELIKYPVLTHARGTQPYKEVEQHFHKRRDLPIRLTPSSNLAACVHMAIDGFGVAAVPKAMIAKELKSGQLFELDYAWTPKALEFFARYDAEKTRSFIKKASNLAAAISASYSK